VSGPAAHRDATLGAACVLAGAVSIQSAAAIAFGAFAAIGAAATSGFRFLVGAVVLVVVVRPTLRGRAPREWRRIAAFGVAAAAMNLCFFQALARLPLGTAVSIEFLGPFVLAVVAGRGRRHAVYAVCGFAGVVLLARPGGGVTLVGALFALGAALGWASYTLASQRLGTVTDGVDGLALALCLSAVLTLPFAAGQFGALDGRLALRLVVAGTLSVVVGFALELSALRRLHASTVAVLFSLNPAVAFAIGFLVLHQHVPATSLVGGLLVVAAGAGVTSAARRSARALPPS
jgi:inner membrane transporter RhtA